jgi:hypothetical protein
MSPVLKELTPVQAESPSPTQAIKIKQRQDEAKVRAKVAEQKANDPISQPLDFGQFWAQVSPTQIWGRKWIDHFKGPGPKMRFSRWYLGHKIIVDTFLTDKLYKEADVEARRSIVNEMGFKYAALGPQHSVKPHERPQLREKFPSLVEQLGLV